MQVNNLFDEELMDLFKSNTSINNLPAKVKPIEMKITKFD